MPGARTKYVPDRECDPQFISRFNSFEIFRPLLYNEYAQERQSNAGRRISINFPDAEGEKPAWRDEP
jgi:hypothetical protein